MNAETTKHFIRYNLPLTNAGFHFIAVAGYNIAAYSFAVADSKGCIVAIHGYLNHSMQLEKFIRFANSNGFSVLCFDLPGHGLSSGERCAIANFTDYRRVLGAVVGLARYEFQGQPLYALGFSVGGAIMLDYHLAYGKGEFNATVLAAPMVRHSAWDITKAVMTVSRKAKKVPRVIKRETGDKDYYQFMKEDPLQGREVSLDWVRAVHLWEAGLRGRGLSYCPIKVLYGLKDGTIDLQHSISYIREHFPNAVIRKYPTAKHELLREAKPIREAVFNDILSYYRIPCDM